MAAAAAGDMFTGKTSFTRNFSFDAAGVDKLFADNLAKKLETYYSGRSITPTLLGSQYTFGFPPMPRGEGLGVSIIISAVNPLSRIEGIARSLISSSPTTTLHRTITVIKNTRDPGHPDALNVVNDAITTVAGELASYGLRMADPDELKGGARRHRSRRHRSTRRKHSKRRSSRRHH